MGTVAKVFRHRRGLRRHSTYLFACFALVAVWLALVGRPACAASSVQVAIIVNLNNDTTDLSLNELEKILRLARQRWNNGHKVYLLMQEEGTPEKEVILERVYRMTSDELKRFWLTKIYRGELTAFPKTLRSNESVLRFVSRVPNAIGFVDAARVDESVKVLKIDGKLPGTENYPLRAEMK